MYTTQHLHLNISPWKRKKVFSNRLLILVFSTNIFFPRILAAVRWDGVYSFSCYWYRKGGFEELNSFPKDTERGSGRTESWQLLWLQSSDLSPFVSLLALWKRRKGNTFKNGMGLYQSTVRTGDAHVAISVPREGLSRCTDKVKWHKMTRRGRRGTGFLTETHDAETEGRALAC